MISLLFLRFSRSTRGVAATEFVLWLAVLVFPLLNAVDLSFYTFQRMQVETAAQAAVQTAWKQCDYTKISSPLVKNCPNDANGKTILQNMLAAAQSLSLGTSVTLTSTDLKEGYFCSNGAGVLVAADSSKTDWQAPSSLPANSFTCVTVLTGNTSKAGDYVQVTAHYTYVPVFQGVSILTSLFSGGNYEMTKTAILRLDGGS